MSASREKDEGLEDRRKRETALKRVSLLPRGRAKRDIVSLHLALSWSLGFSLFEMENEILFKTRSFSFRSKQLFNRDNRFLNCQVVFGHHGCNILNIKYYKTLHVTLSYLSYVQLCSKEYRNKNRHLLILAQNYLRISDFWFHTVFLLYLSTVWEMWF